MDSYTENDIKKGQAVPGKFSIKVQKSEGFQA